MSPEHREWHPLSKRRVEYASFGETGFRFALRHVDGPKRELVLTVLLVEVPAWLDRTANPLDPNQFPGRVCTETRYSPRIVEALVAAGVARRLEAPRGRPGLAERGYREGPGGPRGSSGEPRSLPGGAAGQPGTR